jgi:hypothetical protein
MWQSIVERIPSMLGIVCTILTVAIPYSVYKLNQKLHKIGDPPWKKGKPNEDNN